MRHFIGAGVTAVLLTACGDVKETTKAGADNAAEVSKAAAETIRTADYNDNRNAYFGDLHIHTKNSFDAYIFNVRTTPDDVYRFAKGEAVKHPSGL